MEANSLQAETEVFLSREVEGEAGEDLVEKQNAEQGLMPVVGDEAATYGYTGKTATSCAASSTAHSRPSIFTAAAKWSNSS